jgi:hypothetical protein
MAIRAGALGLGKELSILDVNSAGSGSSTEVFIIDSESVMLSLYVESLSGNLDVVAYTMGELGQETAIITFPTVTAPTDGLLLRKAAAVMQKIRVVATYTGAAQFNVRAKGVSAGAASVKIEGASSFRVSQATATTTPDILIPATLDDRNAVLIVNVNSGSGVLWVAETLAKATALLGAPIYPSGGNLSIDLAAGSAVYAVASTGTIDLRIIETSGG